MKRLLIFLLLVPLAFAGWQTLAAMAIGISVTLLAVAYALGMAFGVNELQIIAKEELYQLVALGIMVAVLMGTDGLLNGISTTPGLTNGTGTMQQTAGKMLDGTVAGMNSLFSQIADYDKSTTQQASRAGQCNIMNTGYGVSGCGGYSMLAAPLSMAGGIVGFSMGELTAMRKLIAITESFALPFLLPVGILLRTFRLTRGAGGFLIALGISMHIMLPAGVIFTGMLAETFKRDAAAWADYGKTAVTDVGECDPLDTSPGDGPFDCKSLVSAESPKNDEAAAKAYCGMRTDIRHYLYVALIEATLGPVISLLMMMAGLRALTSIAGAEVDISAISRFV